MKEGIYKFDFDLCYGNICGTFIANDEDIKLLENNKISVYFGEVLGKHSEVSVIIEPGDFHLLTDDQEVIKVFKKYEMYCGYNPFDQTICSYEMEIPSEVIEKCPKDGYLSDLTVQEYIEILKLC